MVSYTICQILREATITNNIMLRNTLNNFANRILVKDSEFRLVGYFFLFFVFLGCGTALGRGATDTLFFKRYGIEFLPTMYIVLSFVLCAVSLCYAAFADRISGERFFKIIFSSLMSLLVICWAIMSYTSIDGVYPFSFLVYEVASELLLIHSWQYFSQNFDTMQTKRLLPIVLAGTQIGMIVGGLLLANISTVIGVQNILLVWCVMLGVCFWLLSTWHNKQGESLHFRAGYKGKKKFAQAVTQVAQGVRFMKTSPLLRASSYSLYFMVITFYVLCYSVHWIYNNTFTTEESLSSFFGYLTAVNALITFSLQIFVTNRLIRNYGAKKVNILFPVTSLFSYIALFITFTFPAALIGSLNKDSLMQAFRNPIRNLFISALPSNIQGRARAMSIAIVLPLALATCGILLGIMTKMDSPQYFLGLGASAALMYLYFNLRMNKAYVSEIISTLKQKLYIPDSANNTSTKNDAEYLQEISKGLKHQDSSMNISYAKMLIDSYPEKAVEIISTRLESADDKMRDQMLKLIKPLNTEQIHKFLIEAYEYSDDHLKATILNTLFAAKNNQAKVFVKATLEHENARIRAVGIQGALSYRSGELVTDAIRVWSDLVCSENLNDNIVTLELLQYVVSTKEQRQLLSEYQMMITRLLTSAPDRIKLQTLHVLDAWPQKIPQEFGQLIETLFSSSNNQVRHEAIKHLDFLDQQPREKLLLQAIEDGIYDIRLSAIRSILENDPSSMDTLYNWLVKENVGSPRAQQAIIDGLIEVRAPKKLFEEIAMTKTRHAQEFFKAIELLKNVNYKHSSASELMLCTLEEKFEQTIDLSLMSIQTFEHPEKVSAVRAGLKSKDRRLIAQACEVVNFMSNKKLAVMLSSILDSIGKNKELEKKNMPFTDVNTMLAWYQDQSDPWLKTCAMESIKYVLTMLQPSLDAGMSSPGQAPGNPLGNPIGQA